MVYEYLLKFAHDAGHTKAAAVSEQEARASLDRLENLERAKPSGAQVGRYAAVGGGAAVGATALKDLIAKGPRDVLGGPGKRLRTVAANAVAGALTSGAVPLVRSHLDQEAEKHKIRAFLKQPRTTTTVDTPKVAEQAVRQEAGWVEYIKLAAKKSDEQRRDEKHRSKLRRSAAATLGGTVVGGGLTTLGQGALFSAFNNPSEVLKHEGINHSLTRKIKEHGLDLVEAPRGYAYAPNQAVTIPWGASVKDLNSAALAHELGHHSVQQHPILRHTQGTRAMSFRDPGLVSQVGLATGAVSGMSDNPYVRAAGIAAPALLSVPTLASEAGASWNAMKHLRAAGASPAHLGAARKNLLHAFGTYMLNAGAGSIAAGLSHAAVRGLRSIAAKAPTAPAGPTPDAAKLAAGAPTRGDLAQSTSEKMAFTVAEAALASTLGGGVVGGLAGADGAPKDRELEGGVRGALGGAIGALSGGVSGVFGADTVRHTLGLPLHNSNSHLIGLGAGALAGGRLGYLLATRGVQGEKKVAAGAPTRGGFMMASEVPAFRAPNVYRPVHKSVVPQSIVEKMGSATTPAGRLSASRRVGLPKVTAPPGPAIADTVPTFGQRLPGANKTTIGKMGG